MTHEEKPEIPEANVHQSISGIPYPASREELIEYARARSDNGGVVDQLEKLPDIEYHNEPQVLSTLKEYSSS